MGQVTPISHFKRRGINAGARDSVVRVQNHWIVYRSLPAGLPWPATILDIAREAERHNAAAGISGLLLYSGYAYLHYLEGPEAAVTALWDRIAADRRHIVAWTVRGTASARRMPGLPFGLFDADREAAAAKEGPLWRTSHDWPDADAAALVGMLAAIAREKYPRTLGGG